MNEKKRNTLFVPTVTTKYRIKKSCPGAKEKKKKALIYLLRLFHTG